MSLKAALKAGLGATDSQSSDGNNNFNKVLYGTCEFKKDNNGISMLGRECNVDSDCGATGTYCNKNVISESAITKKIIDDHNGSMLIKPLKNSKGTSVVFKFPLISKMKKEK